MSPVAKIVPSSVQAQVVTRLREAIFDGRFAPGQKLSEAALCRAFDVSRTSVREALRSLAGERLVTLVPNRGPHVTRIDWEQASHVYDMRALLEGEAMALLAVRVSAEQLARMRAALDRFAEAAASGDAGLRLSSTQDFYDVILNGCGNPILAELVQGLRARINFLRSRSMSLPDRSVESLREMRAMLQALESGDQKAARKAAVAHIQSARAAAHAVLRNADPLGAD